MLEKKQTPAERLREAFGLSQAEMYLQRALDEFQRAGNAPDLWVPVDDFHKGIVFEAAQEVLTAKNRRLQFLRSSVLFSAISAEAFANEFVDDVLGSNMAQTLDKLSTPDKLIVSVRLATADDSVLKRGEHPMQEITQLFGTRNRLVHPKPKGGLAAWIQHVTDEEERVIGAEAAERAILAVADLVVICTALQKYPLIHGGAAKTIASHLQFIGRHRRLIGSLSGDLPDKGSEGTPALFTQMQNAALAPGRISPSQT